MRRRVALTVDLVRGEGLEWEAKRLGLSLAALVQHAVLHYLSERVAESERPLTRLPRFGRPPAHRHNLQVTLEMGKGDWVALETEAELRGVTVAELAEHAALLFLAEIDAGRPAATRLAEDGPGARLTRPSGADPAERR